MIRFVDQHREVGLYVHLRFVVLSGLPCAMCAMHTQHNCTNFRFAHKISSKRKQKLHEHGSERTRTQNRIQNQKQIQTQTQMQMQMET